MRGDTHKPFAGRRFRALAGIGGALAAAVMLAGCSTANLTGFDFPVFGLTEKSEDSGDEARDRRRYDGAASGQRLDSY